MKTTGHVRASGAFAVLRGSFDEHPADAFDWAVVHVEVAGDVVPLDAVRVDGMLIGWGQIGTSFTYVMSGEDVTEPIPLRRSSSAEYRTLQLAT